MIIPYRFQISYVFAPVSNAVIIGLTCAIHLLITSSIIPESIYQGMILQEWSFDGMLGCVFLHGGYFHLIGNMVFLWVFGNAINSVVGNVWYSFVYLFLGLCASAAHLMFSDMPAIGASGAVNGIIGMSLVLFPVNKLNCFYLIAFFGGKFEVRGYWMIIMWFIFDITGAAIEGEGIAYAAHLGGFASGIAMATILLAYDKIATYDRSIFDIIYGRGEGEKFSEHLDPKKIQAAQYDIPLNSDEFDYDMFSRIVREKTKSGSPSDLFTSSPDPFESSPDPFESSASDPFAPMSTHDSFTPQPVPDEESGKLDAFFSKEADAIPPRRESSDIAETPTEMLPLPVVSLRLLRILRETQQCTCFIVNEGDELDDLSVESPECSMSEIYPNKSLKKKEPGWIKLRYQESNVPPEVSFTLVCRGGSEGTVRLRLTADEASKKMIDR